jgi:hypothetical protein
MVIQCTVLGLCVFSQEPRSILNSYERNFLRASLADKVEILNDAATDDAAGEFIGALYDFALRFCLDNAELLRDDPDMISLVTAAARGLGAAAYAPAGETLWQVFSSYRNNATRIAVLGCFSAMGRDNNQAAGRIGQFLAEQNRLSKAGTPPDYLLLRALVFSLGKTGGGESYPVLFQTMLIPYREDIGIEEAFFSIPGDLRSFLRNLIHNGSTEEKTAALRLAVRGGRLESPVFSDEELGEFAERGLQAGLALDSAGGTGGRELRNLSIDTIRRVKRTRAYPLVSRHFYLVENAYGGDPDFKKDYLGVIECLAAMESPQAAQALYLQLGNYNSKMRQNPHGTSVDVPVLIALIEALGELGDKSAFDYLNYALFLSYPESVHAAARAAIERLKR